MSKFRRINFAAGPGAGKSTTAAATFAQIKKLIDCGKFPDIKVELVQEYVKEWAWIDREIKPWDQLHIFTTQLHKEYTLLSHGVDLIITDSPLFMYGIYAEQNNTPAFDSINKIIKDFEEEFPSINFFLSRKNKKYLQHGRYHSLDEAKLIDNKILTQTDLQFIHTNYLENDFIINEIMEVYL